MTTKVRNALHRAKSRAQRKSAPKRALQSRSETVSEHDGLTDSERLDLLVRYRATVGSKPAMTEAHRLRSEAIAEKLGARPRPRRVA